MLGQAKVLFDYWPTQTEWFVVGGPANWDEAQTVHAEYLHVKCIGFEPNLDFVEAQNEELEFPGIVHNCALWSSEEKRSLITPQGSTHMSSSICRKNPCPDVGEWIEGESVSIQTRTLDLLSREFGPFRNAVLWLDIEYAELEALKGATDLLESGSILLINLESFAHLDFPEVNRLLSRYGFVLQKVWNIGTVAGQDAQDYLYLLER
jgi:FkbM family methyltransferase